MLEHLVFDRPAPTEWVEFVLMDRFKWTLSETRAVPLAAGLALLTMMSAEGKAAKTKSAA